MDLEDYRDHQVYKDHLASKYVYTYTCCSILTCIILNLLSHTILDE